MMRRSRRAAPILPASELRPDQSRRRTGPPSGGVFAYAKSALFRLQPPCRCQSVPGMRMVIVVFSRLSHWEPDREGVYAGVTLSRSEYIHMVHGAGESASSAV